MKKTKTQRSKRSASSAPSSTSTQLQQAKYLLTGLAVAAIVITLYARVSHLNTSSKIFAADRQYKTLLTQVKNVAVGELHAEIVPQLGPNERIAGGTMTGQKLYPDCLGANGYLQFQTTRSFEVVVQEFRSRLEKDGWEYFNGMAEFRNVHYFYDPAEQIRLEIFQSSKPETLFSEYLYVVNFSFGSPKWASCNGV